MDYANVLNICEKITDPFTKKLLNEAVIAADGYVYEKKYIENLSGDKLVIISPITNEEMKTEFILFTEMNLFLKDFYAKNPQLKHYIYNIKPIYSIKHYTRDIDISLKVIDMILDKKLSYDEIISYVKKYNENNIFINGSDICKIADEEKGIKFALSEYNKTTNSKSYLIDNLIQQSSILTFNHIKQHFKPVHFYCACLYGKYELVQKMYNYDHNLIKYSGKHEDYKRNVFYAALKSHNIDIIKFIHSKDSTLYKKTNIAGRTPIIYGCLISNLEIIKFLHSIDNTLYLTNKYKDSSVFEETCYYFNIEIIKYLFSIDKDIFNKEINKDRIIKNICGSCEYDQFIAILKLINDNL